MSAFVYPVVAIPPGAIIAEFKYCECCGCPFVRKFAPTQPYVTKTTRIYSVALTIEFDSELRKDHGDRYCAKCRSRSLLPDTKAQEEYKSQMPGTEIQMRHAMHLPRYDTSIFVRDRRELDAKRAPKLRREAVVKAFADKGTLTAEEMQELIPGCLTPALARMRVSASSDIKIRSVGRLASSTERGRGPAVYVLVSAKLLR